MLSKKRSLEGGGGRGRVHVQTRKTKKEDVVRSFKNVDDGLIPCLRQTAKRRRVLWKQNHEERNLADIPSAQVCQVSTAMSSSSYSSSSSSSCPPGKRGRDAETSKIADSSRKRKRCERLRANKRACGEFAERDKKNKTSCQMQGSRSDHKYEAQKCSRLRKGNRLAGKDESTKLTPQQEMEYNSNKGEGIVHTFSKSKWLFASKQMKKKGEDVRSGPLGRSKRFLTTKLTDDGEREEEAARISHGQQRRKKCVDKPGRKAKESPCTKSGRSKPVVRFSESCCSTSKSRQISECKSSSDIETWISLPSTSQDVGEIRPSLMKASRSRRPLAHDFRYPAALQTLPGLQLTGIAQQHRPGTVSEVAEGEEAERTRKKSVKRKGRKKKNRRAAGVNASQSNSCDPGIETGNPEEERKGGEGKKEGRKEGTSFPTTLGPVLQSGAVLKGICKRPGTPIASATKEKKRVRL
ncbi:axoneme-associated protein mst101(2)-like [Macrobrachium rosenbergii]|uniref:axoneme-associated protein mst101(2)-like n=1 Tax=Macrobrachium rosenbergii TaxID=79674 RepID=UPI0034D59898